MKRRASFRTSTDRLIDNRPQVLVAVIFLCAFAIVARLFNVQVLDYEAYAARAGRQHTVEEELVPSRGRIFVRSAADTGSDGLYPLAANKEFALVYAVPKDVKQPAQAAAKLVPVMYPLFYDEPDVEKLVTEIEQRIRAEMFKHVMETAPPPSGEEVVLNEDEVGVAVEKERLLLVERLAEEKEANTAALTAELEAKLGKADDPYEPLAKKVEKEKLAEIMALDIKGIEYSLSSYRYYPEGTISSQVLGYVVENPEGGGLTQGSYGLEGNFDELLRGIPGTFNGERDAAGRPIIVADRELTPAVDGSDLVLTLDKTVQDVACRKLNQATLRHGADHGALVIIEPATGAVIAMCSYPDFDPNNYGETKDLSYFNNTAIFHAYEPGSVFKAVTMAMGVDTGHLMPETKFTDPGEVRIADARIRNAEDRVYGDITMTEALEFSVNTAMIHIAQTVGWHNFLKYAEDFGFGAKTGIRLNTESSGTLASLHDPLHGDGLNLAVASFGQSITATPLQLAVAYGAFANGGKLMQPYIVDEIIRPDGTRTKTEPAAVRQVITPRTASIVSGMLVNVVERGHAKRAGVPGYYVAAKTGTAQMAATDRRGYSNKTNHTLVGFAPANEPRFVMVTYMQDPKDARYAESSVAPLFGEVAAFLLDYYQVPKER